MKKLISLIIICVIIIGLVYYLKDKGSLDIGKYVKGKEIKNEDIVTNSLQSKNSVYYYNKLSDYEKEIYNKLLSGISKLDNEITLEVNTETDQAKTSKDVSESFGYIFADHPEIWYVKPSYEIKVSSIVGINVVKINVEYTLSSIAEMNQEVKVVQQKIDEIISKTIKSNMTDYQKEIAVHDYLAEKIEYYNYTNINNIPDSKHSAYGGIVDNSAVCDGMTKAYQLVLNKLNIENVFVQGTTAGAPHAWNLVKLDGEYYHIDLTSSATIMGETKANLPVHAYVNITDQDILVTHTIERREILPLSTAVKYNYYKYEGKEITHMDTFSYKLKEIINSNKNNKLLEVKITGIYNPSEKLIDELYTLDYNQMKTKRQNKVSYNKVLDVYIVPNT